jgi:hypothetical protein
VATNCSSEAAEFPGHSAASLAAAYFVKNPDHSDGVESVLTEIISDQRPPLVKD